MSNLSLEQTREEIEQRNFFDIGIIDTVVVRNMAKSDDKKEQDYNMDIFPEPINLYNITVVTRSAHLVEIPVIQRKNMILTPAKGDQVLIGYLGLNKFPFIWDVITWDYRGARRTNRIPFTVDEDEVYLTANRANFLHIRKDGAVVLRGSDVFNTEGESHSYIIIGGNQGTSVSTDKRIFITIGIDQIGPVLSVDEDGNTTLTAQSKLLQNSQELDQIISSTFRKIVGSEQNDDNTRKGDDYEVIGKKKEIHVGESFIIKVGDITKDDQRKQATAEISIAKKCTLNVGGSMVVTLEDVGGKGVVTIDQGDHKIIMNEQGIYVGEGATHKVLLSYKVMNKFNTHKHPMNGMPPTPDGMITPGDLSSEPTFVK